MCLIIFSGASMYNLYDEEEEDTQQPPVSQVGSYGTVVISCQDLHTVNTSL